MAAVEKSTLGSELLKFPDIELLSDDSPLIDRNGTIHAFHCGSDCSPTQAGAVPKIIFAASTGWNLAPSCWVNYKYFSDRGPRHRGSWGCCLRPAQSRQHVRDYASRRRYGAARNDCQLHRRNGTLPGEWSYFPAERLGAHV